MSGRAADLIERLALRPHPEGGYYREIFRSGLGVRPEDDRPRRDALTSIYFLLTGDTHSRWHRVTSDEVWCFLEGDPMELLMFEPGTTPSPRAAFRLGPVDRGQRPQAVVPAGWWQAARPLGDYVLVGCTVGPGFDFADFSMMADDEAAASALREGAPELAALI